MTKLVPAVRGFEDFYNMLDDFFHDPWVSRRSQFRESFKVDVRETDDTYQIEAELPGVDKNEIQLMIDEGRLTIKVEREERSDEDEENYIHRERRYCSMQRSLYLKDAGQDNVAAKLDNGILKIEVPKVQPINRNRMIEIE